VKELIYENHDLLNRLGICTDKINDIIVYKLIKYREFVKVKIFQQK